MWKTHVLDMSLLFMSSSYTATVYLTIKKQKLIIVNFMEIKACKGKIYLHRNLIKILDQRYCKKCLSWWLLLLLEFYTIWYFGSYNIAILIEKAWNKVFMKLTI